MSCNFHLFRQIAVTYNITKLDLNHHHNRYFPRYLFLPSQTLSHYLHTANPSVDLHDGVRLRLLGNL